jgi:hypothetical protein
MVENSVKFQIGNRQTENNWLDGIQRKQFLEFIQTTVKIELEVGNWAVCLAEDKNGHYPFFKGKGSAGRLYFFRLYKGRKSGA